MLAVARRAQDGEETDDDVDVARQGKGKRKRTLKEDLEAEENVEGVSGVT